VWGEIIADEDLIGFLLLKEEIKMLKKWLTFDVPTLCPVDRQR